MTLVFICSFPLVYVFELLHQYKQLLNASELIHLLYAEQAFASFTASIGYLS
jgi:hypothetical protein